jgi:hypothetical protein
MTARHNEVAMSLSLYALTCGHDGRHSHRHRLPVAAPSEGVTRPHHKAGDHWGECVADIRRTEVPARAAGGLLCRLICAVRVHLVPERTLMRRSAAETRTRLRLKAMLANLDISVT